MERTITKDKSVSFMSRKYDEFYHSQTGAVEEAFEKYAKPCRIKDGMKVLDICFGIGYETLAAIHTADVEIVGLENDPEILKQAQDVEVEESLKSDYEKVKQAAKNLEYKDDKVKIRIILGDARETIKAVNEKFDAVFLDPFSPKKCPELWTYEFMADIAKRMNKGAVLATYSCARLVRDNLRKAGFEVKDGPCVGRRGPSTLAYLT